MSPNLESSIVHKLSTAHSKLSRYIEGSLTVHGISYTEYQVMRCLFQSPDMTMRRIQLAECIGLTASGVTRLLTPMEKIGLVRKQVNSRDARVSLVELTSAGKNLFINAEKTVGGAAECSLNSLRSAQKAKLLEILDLIA